MEGNLSSGNVIPGGGSFGGLDLQGSIRVNHHHHHKQKLPLTLHQQHQPNLRQGSMVHPPIHEVLPLTIGTMQECGQMISLSDYTKGERGKNSCSDDDDTGFMEDTSERGKKLSTWQRVKWTDTMVRLLITAVSYMGEDASAEHSCGSRRKNGNLQKKGKWKLVSKVMAERGHFVSPQQCEDKFNDLNKRYKRLNEILGRGTSCEVVENPPLLDSMDISEKSKDEVRKILSSKHLYYEEMCSYHNGNRLHLPPDPELQHSLRLALGSRDDHENNDLRRYPLDEFDEDDRETELDDQDEFEENHTLCRERKGIYGMVEGSSKRLKQCQGLEDFSFGNVLKYQNVPGDMNQVLPAGMKENVLENQWMKQRSIQLEEQLLQIESQMLELEKERFKWQRFNEKRDRELETMRMENERMKLENEHIALELKRKEMGVGNN